MTTTTTTATSLIAKHRLAIALLAALTLLGLTPGAVSAQPSDLVQCLPTEFQPCPTVDPEPGTPFVVVEDLVVCELGPNHLDSCDEPDPEPENPLEGPNKLQICELDENLQNPCDDEPDPEGPGIEILPPGGDGGGDDDGGEEPGDPEDPQDPTTPGIDDPVTGNPDFTG